MSRVNQIIQSVNKAIGALIGGGVVALLVGFHVITGSQGVAITSILTVVGAVLGTYIAPPSKPFKLRKPDNTVEGPKPRPKPGP